MLTLIAAPVQEMAVSPWVALAVSAAFGAITVFLVRLAVRARRMKSQLGPSALVGCGARAMEPLTPEGHVLVEGEIWSAVSSTPVPVGAPLRVVGLEKYLLHVEPAEPQSPPQRPA
jgi:membrane-bound serine protease (ClpP class)